MTSTLHQGAASALPIARAFLELGGRLMLNPQGMLETAGGLRWARPEISAREARKSFTVERRLYRRLRDPRFATSVRCLVLQEGTRLANGWLVVEAQS
jgi:hypothetical protein